MVEFDHFKIKYMKPIWKLNGGLGATLCHKCSKIISIGFTKDLYCSDKCKEKHNGNKARKD